MVSEAPPWQMGVCVGGGLIGGKRGREGRSLDGMRERRGGEGGGGHEREAEKCHVISTRPSLLY